MENKTMKISEFVKKYNTLTNEQAKIKLAKSIMKTDYIGIVTKRAILQNAIEKSAIDKGVIVYVDSLTSKINFAISIILLYTNLEFEKKDDGTTDTFGGYDLLMKNNLFDVIIGLIGESEIDELGGVNASLLENYYTENSSTAAMILRYINKILTAVTTGFDKFLGNVENTLSDERVVSVINEAISKYKK